MPAVREKLPVAEYGAVPPAAVTVTVADPPLHAIDPEEEAAESCVGSVMVMVVVAVQLLASVTMKL